MPAATIRVLILSLRGKNSDSHYKGFVYAEKAKSLGARAYVKTATNSNEAIRYLAERPEVVIVTDDAIACDDNDDVTDKLIEFVEGGGTTILTDHSKLFHYFENSEEWFERWGLPWRLLETPRRPGGMLTSESDANNERGIVSSSESSRNEGSILLEWKFPLPDTCPSRRGLLLENVPIEHIVYWPYIDTDVISSEAPEFGMSHAAFGRVGAGYLGFLGDISYDSASEAILLAMCGI